MIKKIISVAGVALAVGVTLGFAFEALAFNGPAATPPTGSGAIGSDSANNVSIGSASTLTGTKLLVSGATNDASTYAEKIDNVALTPLFIVRDDGAISIDTSTVTAGDTIIGNNLIVGGSVTAASLGGSTISAGNVSAGSFGSNTGGGNYSFPSNAQATSFTINGGIGGNTADGLFGGNGDNAIFSTVDTQIESWWGLGFKSSCCNTYSGYGIVFDPRAGAIYTQGSVGVGTASPTAKLTVSGSGGLNVDLSVNGRIQTGDGSNYGGIWVNNPATEFIGNDGGSLIGLYNSGWGLTMNSSQSVNIANGLTVDGTNASTEYGASAEIWANGDNHTGGGIDISDEGGFYDYNDGYVTYNGSHGLRIAGNNGPSSSGGTLWVQGQICLNGVCNSSWPGGGATSAGNITAGTFGSAVGGGNFAFPGNITLNTTNAQIIGGGSSWINVPYGLYLSGGTTYDQTQLQARGGIHNDSAGYLELDGGTSNYTYVKGSLGIGTASPSQALEVNGNAQIDGKLTVSTIDPVYAINGDNYATYAPSMTGVNEETTGLFDLTCDNGATGSCSTTIDFNTLTQGSDLWLFGKATNLPKNLNDLVVMLTPSFNGKVWYQKNITAGTITLYGDQAGEVSYRLSAPRFDAGQWPNTAPMGETPSFTIN